MRYIIYFFCFSILCASCKNEKQEDKKPSRNKFPAPAVNIPKQKVTDGTEQTFYSNGQLKTEGTLVKGQREGRWAAFYEDGLPWSETHFKNGLRDGPTTTWYENGQKRYVGFYTYNKPSGKWTFWNEDGSLAQEINYDK